MKKLIGVVLLIIGIVGLFILAIIATYSAFGLMGASIAFCIVAFLVGAVITDD